jgi:hypothetical protein
MDQDADESKGHFDQIQSKIGPYDQLLVLFWRWDTDGTRSWPQVIDAFLDSAMEIAELRDQLHLARGGRFVDGSSCPDKCVPGSCPHAGEPLNARGIRERRFGPSATRGANVSYAANFGGLVRMLKTQNVEASKAFKKMRRESDVAHNYISFIHRHLPAEELNAYSTAEWGELYEQVIGKIPKGMRPAELRSQISAADSGYRELLRSIDLTQGS